MEEDSVYVVKEIYDSSKATEMFERELDGALENGCGVIIIEPNRLGEETARWISVGNGLHKCAVVFGLSSIGLSFSWHKNSSKLLVPCTLVSVFCAGLYMISWQFDPCCKYQVANETERLKLFPFLSKSTYCFSSSEIANASTPVILLRKNDRTRKIIHSAVALLALSCTIIRFCK